jgi:hypothetical protein
MKSKEQKEMQIGVGPDGKFDEWVSERVHQWVGGINHMRFLNVCASSCTMALAFHKQNQGCAVALPFTLQFSILRQKERIMANPLKVTKFLQHIIIQLYSN